MRRALVVGSAAVAVVALVALRACTGDDRDGNVEPTPPASTIAAAAEDGIGPSATVNGVPVGWSRDAAGARAAAVSAVSLSGGIATAGFITRADMIETLASERFGAVLAAESAGQLRELLGDLAEQGITPTEAVFEELPLTARLVDADDDDRARVEVWSLLVLGVPNGQAPRQLWHTVTVELCWEHDDWRVDGWAATPGPTPALTATAEIASVSDVAGVLAWPAAPTSSGVGG